MNRDAGLVFAACASTGVCVVRFKRPVKILPAQRENNKGGCKSKTPDFKLLILAAKRFR